MIKLIPLLLFAFIILDIQAENIPFLKSTPEIDGKINSQEWANSLQFGLQKIKGGTPDNQTTVFLGHDNEFLYAAFKCYEKNMDSIRLLRRNPEEKDNAIWDDDCVEIFIDPFNSGNEKFYHIIINSAAIVYDAAFDNPTWDSGLKTAAFSDAKSWTVEIAIPFASLPYAPKGCELWNFNFAREKKSPSEISCFKPGSDALKALDHFSEFGFQTEATPFPFILKKLKDGVKSALVFEFNKEPSDKAYEIEVSGKQSLSAKPGERLEISYAADKNNSIDIKVSENKAVIYENKVAFYQPPARVVVRKISNPLYKELWSEEPAGLVKNGAMYWSHLKDKNELRSFALQYGLRYVYEDSFKDAASNNLITIGGTTEITKWTDFTVIP